MVHVPSSQPAFALSGRRTAWPWGRLVAAAFLFLTGGPAVLAENDGSNLRYWLQDGSRAGKPVATPTRNAERIVHRQVVVRPAPTDPSPARVTPKAPTQFVAVLGDNLAQLLGQGLNEAFADRADVGIARKAKDSSGLVRLDVYDWQRGVRDLLAGPEKINVAVMMIGSNDRQAIAEGAAAFDVGSPGWKQRYTQRVEDIAAQFHQKGVPLIWVGLPVVRNERLAADYLSLNDIFREQAEKASATYVDVWEAFVDDNGRFSPFGPDVNGQIARLRSGDGVNFTPAGARKLAHFVEASIHLDLAKAGAGPQEIAALPADASREFDRALDVDVNAQIRRELNLPAPSGTAPAGAAVVRPPAGATVSLTGPTFSGGGLLASRQTIARLFGPSDLVSRVLVEGRPVESVKGRADDATWPKP